MVEQVGGDLEGQAGFAHTARPGEGEQANVVLQQQVLGGCDLVVAANQWAAG
jgi:hypothetical protein